MRPGDHGNRARNGGRARWYALGFCAVPWCARLFCVASLSPAAVAQTIDAVAKPAGLYLAVAADDAQRERMMLWRFGAQLYTFREHRELDNLIYDPSQAQLDGEPIGNFPPSGTYAWTGDELILGELPEPDDEWSRGREPPKEQGRYQVRAIAEATAAGCFSLIDAAGAMQQLCPAPALPRGLRLEGIYVQRKPTAADESFVAEKLTFHPDLAYERDWYGDHWVRGKDDVESVYGRIVELGSYRVLQNAIGLSERGTKMAYAVTVPLGDWIDAKTPRTLFWMSRIYDFLGRPAPVAREGLVREGLVIAPHVRGQPHRIYKTWIKLRPEGVDPGEGNDPPIEDFPDSAPLAPNFGARLSPLDVKQLAKMGLVGVTMGLRVSDLQPYAASWDSSLQNGDVILSIGGVRFKNMAEFRRIWTWATNGYQGVRLEFVRP